MVRNLQQCLCLRGIWINIPVACFVLYMVIFSKSHNRVEFSEIISSGLARKIFFLLLPLLHVHWKQPLWLEKNVKKHIKPVNEVKLLLCFPAEITIPANKLRTWKQILSCRGSDLGRKSFLDFLPKSAISVARPLPDKVSSCSSVGHSSQHTLTLFLYWQPSCHSWVWQSHSIDTDQQRHVSGRKLSLRVSAAP